MWQWDTKYTSRICYRTLSNDFTRYIIRRNLEEINTSVTIALITWPLCLFVVNQFSTWSFFHLSRNSRAPAFLADVYRACYTHYVRSMFRAGFLNARTRECMSVYVDANAAHLPLLLRYHSFDKKSGFSEGHLGTMFDTRLPELHRARLLQFDLAIRSSRIRRDRDAHGFRVMWSRENHLRICSCIRGQSETLYDCGVTFIHYRICRCPYRNRFDF
jgi:hypothetical protein